MDELGAWNFAHGTGAGCASIVAWEGTHLLLSSGVAMIVFAVLTALIMHAVHRHRMRLLQRSGVIPDASEWGTRRVIHHVARRRTQRRHRHR